MGLVPPPIPKLPLNASPELRKKVHDQYRQMLLRAAGRQQEIMWDYILGLVIAVSLLLALYLIWS